MAKRNINIYYLLRIIRNKSTTEVSSLLKVTSAYINALELGTRTPSEMVIDGYSRIFNVDINMIKSFNPDEYESFEHAILDISRRILMEHEEWGGYYSMKDNIVYQFNPDGVNVVTDELSPTSFMALREVRWSEEDDYHLDFRRYFCKPDGTEMPGKGTAIPNPDKLISALINSGRGSTRECVDALWTRDDFIPSIAEHAANYSDDEYTQFKDNLDAERDSIIRTRGMSADEFMEKL